MTHGIPYYNMKASDFETSVMAEGCWFFEEIQIQKICQYSWYWQQSNVANAGVGTMNP